MYSPNHLHAEVNPMNFNNLKKNLFEETKTANASFAPEVTRLEAREAQLSTRVSTRRKQETELQGLLLNLVQENARINALMNQIQTANSSIDTTNPELKQVQTSNFKISRLQAEGFDM